MYILTTSNDNGSHGSTYHYHLSGYLSKNQKFHTFPWEATS